MGIRPNGGEYYGQFSVNIFFNMGSVHSKSGSFCIYQKSSDSFIFSHMEHKENKSDSNVTSVYKILLCDENSKDVANKPEKTNKTDQFPAQVAGPGSSGGKRVKTNFTPPDASGYVRSSSDNLQLIPKLSQKKNIT